jgi:putative permease
MTGTEQGNGAAAAERPVGSSPATISDPALRFEAKRAIIWSGVVGAVVLAVLLAHSLLVIFAGIVFAAMIDGGARLLARVIPSVGRGLRIAIVLLSGVGFLVWVVMFAGNQITREAAALPAIVELQVNAALAWAKANGFAVEAADIKSVGGQLLSGVGIVTRALSGLLGGLASTVLIAIIGLYVALEPRLYERGVEWMLPASRREDFLAMTAQMASKLRHLLAGRLLGMVIEGIFTWAMLALYGVPMAALLGLLTGLLAFIPNIGAVISGLLMVLVGFSGGSEMGLYTIFVYFAVQTIDGYLLIPLIAKKTVDLAPALVLAGQLIMGVLFGVMGLALADPLIAMIKVALERRASRGEREAKLQAAAWADA